MAQLMWAFILLASFGGQQARCDKAEKFSLDKVLDLAISRLIGQKSEDSNATPDYYKAFLLEDNSNENLATFSAHEILNRSGYEYENHYVTSDDGYITNLLRIVNPLANKSKLKQPPVMMMHGGFGDPTTWYWSSTIQHHPEKWPRVAEDGPITSWNKSLALVLVNNGYDVWMVGTRGSSIFSKGHTRLKRHFTSLDWKEFAMREERPPPEVMAPADANSRLDFEENFKYWNYSMDDIGRYEVPRQQEKILQVTSAANLTLIDLSLSTPINLALMSENAHFVSRLHNYVTMAPILTNKGTNLAIKTFHETFCTKLPVPLGTLLLQIFASQPSRESAQSLNSLKEVRYSLVKQLTRVVAGPSARYETNLDSGVVSLFLQSFGFKELRHYCQQMIAGRLQKYDHGESKNLLVYGSRKPPAYDLSKIQLPNWMLISGGNDKLATVDSVNLLLASVSREPTKHVHVGHYNHQDLLAAVENDRYVNLPALKFLDKFALHPEGQEASTG